MIPMAIALAPMPSRNPAPDRPCMCTTCQDEGVELPAFVQRVLIPIFYVLGRALGKYKKYADAPEPIAHA